MKLSHSRSARRRGLAPLEFVLWLPVLLFVAALIVNYGTSAAWRVRGEIVSRDAAWRSRWPRRSADEAPPETKVWPANASMNTAGDSPLSVLDDPRINLPVVRGPLQNGFVVKPVLDPKRGARKGTSEINRRYPMLAKLGEFNSGEIANRLLDEKWSGRSMGIPNVYRRSKTLYDLPWADRTPFENAVANVRSIPNYDALRTFYHADDWYYYIRYHGMGQPDYHPRINPNMCVTDRNEVDLAKIHKPKPREPFVDTQNPDDGQWRHGEITHVPLRMTQGFLRMFRTTLRNMQQRLEDLRMQSPLSAAEQAEIAWLEREIPIVEEKIRQLKAFEDRIVL